MATESCRGSWHRCIFFLKLIALDQQAFPRLNQNLSLLISLRWLGGQMINVLRNFMDKLLFMLKLLSISALKSLSYSPLNIQNGIIIWKLTEQLTCWVVKFDGELLFHYEWKTGSLSHPVHKPTPWLCLSFLQIIENHECVEIYKSFL